MAYEASPRTALGDRITGVAPLALLCLVCLILYTPGLVEIPPLDRDEARFAQATRQMLETGDFLHIRFQNEERNRKPAGIYWLQAASVSLFSRPDSTAMWPYRLPSALGATLAVLLTFGFGARLFAVDDEPRSARSAGLLAAVLLAASLGVVAEAHIAKTDAMLLAAVAAGQGALGLAYTKERAGQTPPLWLAGVFWLAEAAAMLLKGPVAPALAIATAAVLSIVDRDLRWLRGLRPIAGLILAAAIVVPWTAAIEAATGGRFLAQSLGQDLLAKLVGGQDSHGAPPFYYLVLSLASFWPGSLFLVPALAWGWRRHERPAERFLLAWIVPAWLVAELVPTKLPHYVLPLYPALALLAGGALARGFAIERGTWLRIADIAVRSLWAVTTLFLAVLLAALAPRFGEGVSIPGLIGAFLLIGLGAPLLWRRPAWSVSAALAVALSAVFVGIAGWAVLPDLDRLWLSRAAAEIVARDHPRPGLPIVAVGYSEPSLVFLLGTQVELATPAAAAESLAAGGEALVSGRDDAMFRQALAARHLRARPLDQVHGTNYSNGQRMVLTLYAVEPD